MNQPKADSYYLASANQPHKPIQSRAAIDGDCHVDIAIVGAGYTGLSAALHLAKKGLAPLVIDAETVGFGASGRNGGQVSSGQRRPQDELECRFGFDAAMALWELSQDAKALVKNLIAQHHIDCDLKLGVLEAAHNSKNAAELKRYPDYMSRVYGYDHLVHLEGEAFRSELNSPIYSSGVLDKDAAHLHPLNYAQGLARAAEQAGAVIAECTRILKITSGNPHQLETKKGIIHAKSIILACNGYIDDLEPKVSNRIMPLNNFIIATAPLGDQADNLIPSDVAVADTKHVINYFRLSNDRRLLFGGGETYRFQFPNDIANFVRPHMLRVFPSLKSTSIDWAWGGTLAITRSRLPIFQKLGSDIYSASGYSGHGISIATLAGQLLAEAITGNQGRFDIMAQIDPKPFPGGTKLRLPLLWLAMMWFRLKDRL